MSNEVINTVQVQAAAGRSDELGKQLQRIVETLRETPGCDSYLVDRCPEDSHRWTVSARWRRWLRWRPAWCRRRGWRKADGRACLT